MQSNVKYSVIIPVYNAEKTIERCLNSLLKQNREDVELIVINDGSSDKSEEIIRDYVKEYTNIVYVSQENSGVSRARNNGLELAKGEYVSFVDSDDYVSQKYFSVLDEMDDSDLGVFNSCDIGKQEKSEIFKELEMVEDFAKRIELLVASRKIMPPWNKRYKNEIIKREAMRFVEDFEIGEDFAFCMKYALLSKSCTISSEIIYNVDVSDLQSLSRKYRPNISKQMTDVFRTIEKNVKNIDVCFVNTDELLILLDYLYVKNTFTCIAEEFKVKKPNFYQDRKKYISICKAFQHRIGEENKYFNKIHKAIRFLVKNQIVLPMYLVTYWIKWKAFRKYIEE